MVKLKREFGDTLMNRSTLTVAVLLLLLALCSGCDDEPKGEPQAAPAAEKIEYAGWTDCWRLKHAKLEVVIVPAVGRIMHLSTPGGANLLWQDEKLHGKTAPPDGKQWFNYGGDKVWPAEQSQWPKLMGRGWPPDEAFDGSACTAEPIPGGVRITTPLSKSLGARGIREFTLVPDAAALHVRQWIEKTAGDPKPLTLWTVTQVRAPKIALMAAEREEQIVGLAGAKEKQLYTLDADARAVTLRNQEKAQKLGTQAPEAWCAAQVGGELIVQSRRLDGAGGYPDKGCAVEIYTSPGESFVELELLSPLREVKTGETLRDDCVWQVLEAPADAAAKELSEQARKAHAQALKWLEAK
ncbi:MAG: DUF4380 domain-containing protein [Planctomycetes bacterium]|nr:DUF4380 domain-containing protein [Planctomycetota bacterium]